MDDVTETGTEIAAQEPEAPVTLAEHRREFPAKGTRNTPLPQPVESDGTPAPKHRAKSQRANVDDVKEIARLTKELREAEEAVTIDRKPGESERVFALRRRAEIAKLAQAKPQPAPKAEPLPPAPVPRPVPQPQPTQAMPTGAGFTEPEPIRAQFANDGDFARAAVAWDRRKEKFEEGLDQQRAAFQEQRAKFDNEMIAEMNAHSQRVGTVLKDRPDIKALFDAEKAKPEAEQIQLTLAMRGAIEFHEKGPEMVAALIKNPDLADELFLLTNGRAVGDPRTDSLVATVRRRLLQRVAAVTTGAAPASRLPIVAPHPPTPVRTAPQTPREKPSSGTPSSLAEHSKLYPPPRRH